MGDINYYKARTIIPSIGRMEEAAKINSKRYDPAKEPEYYRILHDPKSTQAEKEKVENEMLEVNMITVFDFLKGFRYCVDKAEIMEDLMQEGFIVVMDAIEKWDINRGNFRAMLKMHLKKLYRNYYREVTLRPQTGCQNDAKVKKYDAECLLNGEKLKSPEEVAKALNISSKTVIGARQRGSAAGTIESIERLQENNPNMDAYSIIGETTEDKSDSVFIDSELIREARNALKKNKFSDRLIFDFLVMPGNWELSGKEFADKIFKATGYNFTYQQIYRAKQSIGTTLVHKNILDRSSIKKNAKRLDIDLEKKRNMELKQKNKWAFLFKDSDEEGCD